MYVGCRLPQRHMLAKPEHLGGCSQSVQSGVAPDCSGSACCCSLGYDACCIDELSASDDSIREFECPTDTVACAMKPEHRHPESPSPPREKVLVHTHIESACEKVPKAETSKYCAVSTYMHA